MREQKPPPDWRLALQGIEHDLHFYGAWDWEGDGRALKAQQEFLREVIDERPPGVTAIECRSSGIGCGCEWDEQLRGQSEEGAVAAISAYLARLQDGLS